jgi:hypothetical protein
MLFTVMLISFEYDEEELNFSQINFDTTSLSLFRNKY